MQLLEVTNSHTIELFHQVAARLYRNDPNWIPHVVQEVEQLFDPERNGAFQDGAAKRWVLLNRNFEPVGRIAAFYGKKSDGNTTGGLGFYECIADDRAAQGLFQQAESWLVAEGMMAVDGPVNFGERHQFWGCQTEGFGIPIYQENYHPNYYQNQFLTNGYQLHFKSLTFQVAVAQIPFRWLERLYQRTHQPTITYCKFNPEKSTQFAEDYLNIAAEAFQLKNRTVKLDKDSILSQLNIQKSVFQEDFIWFAYQDGNPVGVLGYVLNWAGLVANALLFGEETREKSLKGFLVAIKPEYQQTGILTGLLYHFGQALLANPDIKHLYICGIAEYSQNVRSVAKKFHAKQIASHITFRKTLSS
ncbi:MAG: hypothetical protein ACPGJS_11685 [Flammeovirgaceae bacterium]